MDTDTFLTHLAFDENGQLYDSSPYFIGLMSGTSLDALDAVLCKFGDEVRLIASESQSFPPTLHKALLALTRPDGIKSWAERSAFGFESELDVFGWASREYAELAAKVVASLLSKAGLNADEICAIGCHGQTVRHRPEWGFSLQLIDPNLLAERTKIAVVSDFRRRDMAVGGQGAPLIPAFHQAMFHVEQNFANSTVVLNLGGIANISVLGETPTGYDTGVANLLMDGWCQRHLGKPYDKDGAWASAGQVIPRLLDALLLHPFLALAAPKSTGREAFHLSWLDSILTTLPPIMPIDVQATLCEFTAISASQEINKFKKTQSTLYVCGGGAYNAHLLTRLRHHLPDWQVLTTDAFGICPLWVEAMGFAWLARQTIIGEAGNIPAVTGANKAVVLGQICF